MVKGNAALAAYKAGARARAGKVHHKRKAMTVSLAVAGGFIPLGIELYNGYREGGLAVAGNRLSMATTGIDTKGGAWRGDYALRKLYGPLLVGALAHKMANALGINRMLARWKVPFIRV
jgi:hypothetical protein